jgi:hypothetical protein
MSASDQEKLMKRLPVDIGLSASTIMIKDSLIKKTARLSQPLISPGSNSE